MALLHSFFWLSNIPSFKIHYIFILTKSSSLSRLLGYFHVLPVVDGAVVIIGVHVSFQIRVFVFPRYILRSGIACSWSNPIFSFFKGTSILFSIVVDSHQQCGRVSFLHTLSSIYCRLFDDGHSDWCKVIPHCSFDFHFSNN